MADRTNQRAGDNSQQMIIENYHAGITEERVIAIVDERARLVVEQHTAEAAPIAHERIQMFDRKLVRDLAQDELLNAFADPAFLGLVQRAQINAASTERESDYDLLSKLVTQRAKDKDRYVAATVQKAVEIIHLTDEAALIGLTVTWMAFVSRPLAGALELGLTALDDTFAEFPLDDLPTGQQWLNHLDTLDAVRLSQLGPLTKYSTYLSSRLPGYLSKGFTREQGSAINAQVAEIRPNWHFELLQHEFNPDLLRLNHANSIDIDEILEKDESLGEEQRASLVRIAKADGHIDEIDETYRPAFEAAIDSHSNLRKLRAWWDQIPVGFDIASCGHALAYVAAQQYHPLGHLQPFDEFLRA